jgi:membrane protease YdiL (CAAX protease family)
MLAAALVVGVVGVAAFAGQGHDLRDTRSVRRLTYLLNEPIAALASLAGGVAMVLASRRLVPGNLHDGSPTGGGWAIGCSKDSIYGVVTGLLVGLCYVVIALSYEHAAGQAAPGASESRFAATLLPQALSAFTAVVLAPLLEEPLFRGLLYGGYRRSFGPVWAAVLTTVLFCAFHVWQMVQFPPAIPGVVASALAALWFRLHSSAIGPAIAVHGAYNTAIVVAIFCRRQLS